MSIEERLDFLEKAVEKQATLLPELSKQTVENRRAIVALTNHLDQTYALFAGLLQSIKLEMADKNKNKNDASGYGN